MSRHGGDHVELCFDVTVGRKVERVPVVLKPGCEVMMTDRQRGIYEMLHVNMGRPVDIDRILKEQDISILNLRVSLCELRKMISEVYTIKSKWSKRYTLVPADKA